MTTAGTATGAGMPTASGTDARTFVLHENVYFAQVPRLSVAHLAINPAHGGPLPLTMVSSASNRMPGLRANHPRQMFWNRPQTMPVCAWCAGH